MLLKGKKKIKEKIVKNKAFSQGSNAFMAKVASKQMYCRRA